MGSVNAAAGFAAAGRRRAALGANFLPEVFLLMKELNVAGACALSAACAGGGAELSSAMIGCAAMSTLCKCRRGLESDTACGDSQSRS